MSSSRLESLGVSLPRQRLLKWGSLDHAVEAGRSSLAGSTYHPEDVAVMINAGVYRDKHYAEPAFACYIQEKLGINVEFQGRQTLSFDLLNGGCGLLNAAHVISTMQRAGTVRVGMAIASEVNADRKPDPSWSYAASGAAFTMDISPFADRGFGAFVFRTFDAHHDDYGSAVLLDRPRGKLVIRKAADIEQRYLDHVGEVLDELCEAEGLRREQIDLVVPAQISPTFVQGLPAALGLPADKVLDLSAELPDTLTTSWVLALHLARQRGRLVDGQRAVFLAVGSGVTIGAAAYRF